jgi:hypothetical protein
MKMLDMDSTAEKVLEEFPMLEGLSKFELTMMRSDTEDEDSPEEDQLLARGIDILFERIQDGTYHAPSDEDDEPGGVKVYA